MRFLAAITAPALLSSSLTAQSGVVLSGRVLTDSTRTPVVNAAVAIPRLNKSTTTDEQGRFHIAEIKPGSHEIVVRHGTRNLYPASGRVKAWLERASALKRSPNDGDSPEASR